MMMRIDTRLLAIATVLASALVCGIGREASDAADVAEPSATAPPAAAPQVRIGGEMRLRYERYVDRAFDPRNGDNGYVLDRALLRASLARGRTATFVQLEHAAQNGGRRPADPTALDAFALSDLYVEYGFGRKRGTFPLTLRVGRQELTYGSGRLIDDRYGPPNTVQSFDGIRVRLAAGGWTTDAFAAQPVNVAAGAFDDSRDRSKSLVGIYATRAAGRDTLDVYAFRDRRSAQTYYRGTRPERRDTIGTRIVVVRGGLRSDTDLAYQTGTFGSAKIRAAALQDFTSYRWRAGAIRWLFGAGAGVGTGDHAPLSDRFGAYRPPYPTGATFGVIVAEGAIDNIGYSFQQQYEVGKFTLIGKELFSYRQSSVDGIYGTPGTPLRAPGESRSAPIGTLAYLSASETLSPHVTLSAAYARYFIDGFLKERGPALGIRSADTSFVTITAQYTL